MSQLRIGQLSPGGEPLKIASAISPRERLGMGIPKIAVVHITALQFHLWKTAPPMSGLGDKNSNMTVRRPVTLGQEVLNARNHGPKDGSDKPETGRASTLRRDVNVGDCAHPDAVGIIPREEGAGPRKMRGAYLWAAELPHAWMKR